MCSLAGSDQSWLQVARIWRACNYLMFFLINQRKFEKMSEDEIFMVGTDIISTFLKIKYWRIQVPETC